LSLRNWRKGLILFAAQHSPTIRTSAKTPTASVSPAEAGRLAGIGRTTIYHAISSGDLKSLKIGARRLVAVEALREWLLKHEVKR
jgi:excisionase family DNA binding protein